MSALDHWHPVLYSRNLKRTPALVRLCGEEIAVFRRASGKLGALRNECPHRRMPLHEGCVRGESLVCAYHGWKFEADGRVSCPAKPELPLLHAFYDVAEDEGVIWLKRGGTTQQPPQLPNDRRREICRVQMLFRAPLELVADNLAEMEHTGEVHRFFGYDTVDMHQVELTTEQGPDSVRIIAKGPQRRLPLVLEKARNLSGAASDDLFVDDLTVRFSPVHFISNGYWVGRSDGTMRPNGLHAHVFLVPRTAHETELFGFFFFMPGAKPMARMMRSVLKSIILKELTQDRVVTEGVAARNTALCGLQLSRFDEPLIAIRDKLSHYYGTS